jgi:magnesium transporter
MDIEHLVRDITHHAQKRTSLFRSLSVAEQAALFVRLSPHTKKTIFDNLKEDELVNLLDQLDMQEAEKALSFIAEHDRRQRIIMRVKTELKEKAEYFLRFHPKAAISLLNFNYLLLSSDTTIGKAADAIEEHHREVGKLPEILVHENGELIGEVPFPSLVRESNSKMIRHFVMPVRSISYQAEIPEIIELLNNSKHSKLAVLDRDGSVIGIIYPDDALALFGGEAAAALYDFAGVDDIERSFDKIGAKVKHRYKWLIINLGTAFLAASVVGLFQDTLTQFVMLAMYMPVVAGMGGNAATQTLAVIVRGIAVGEITLKNSLPAIYKEVGAGFVNGVINGIIVAIVATIWNGDPKLGLVLGIAMIINLVIAGFFGALIPLVMKAMGKDPATSATIFITTATDVFGFFAFLGLATVVLI